MTDIWAKTRMPAMIRNRRWWFILLLLWAMAVAVSLSQHLEGLHRQGLEVASEGARNLFNMVVMTRAWNAGHGGVYVPVSDKSPPNPYLIHPRRDILTRDGQHLTMINPAYMTRQISELARAKGGTEFHITSLQPIRPLNAPDPWERDALAAFERGAKEIIALQAGNAGTTMLRYMAPLKVAPPCMACHAKQGYKVGDIRGGISVSLPFDPILAASTLARQQTWIKHSAAFLVITLLGWGGLELLRRRWHDLAANLTALESARNELEMANTELARARDAAEIASQAKSAFMAAMSHELRTPLNGIVGFAHLLQHANLPVKAKEQAERIAEQGNNLHALINEILEFTRLESMQPPTQTGTISLAALMAGVAEEFRRVGEAKGLRVEIELPSDLSMCVAGEREWLIGCLQPLLNNAVKFTRHGKVGLAAGTRTDTKGTCHLHVTVSDSGIGIAEADHARLFQPFHQIDNAKTRRYGGLGLGLAISARYAELLGAELSFSSAVGQGSQFHLDWTTHIISPLNSAIDGSFCETTQNEPVNGSPALLLAELEQLLSEDDQRSAMALNNALPLLSQAFDAQALAQLLHAIERYDFPAALDIVRLLRTKTLASR